MNKFGKVLGIIGLVIAGTIYFYPRGSIVGNFCWGTYNRIFMERWSNLWIHRWRTKYNKHNFSYHQLCG